MLHPESEDWYWEEADAVRSDWDVECPACKGSGTVYDTVPYGSTTAQLPSTCEDCEGTGKRVVES